MTHVPDELISHAALLRLAREHLGGIDDVYIHHGIPRQKLARAREVHGVAPDGELVVVLHDGTVFGSAEDGFLATPRRFCWKNVLEHPRSMPWDALLGVDLEVRGTTISFAGARIQAPWRPGSAERVRDFLEACAASTIARSAPYRGLPRERDPDTLAGVVVREARRALGEVDWMHYAPSIPERMLRNVRVVHERRLRSGEPILVLYDDTFFGSGSDGFVLTERGIWWRNFLEPAETIAWVDLRLDVHAEDECVVIDPATEGRPARIVQLRTHRGMASAAAEVFARVARAARSERAASQTETAG